MAERERQGTDDGQRVRLGAFPTAGADLIPRVVRACQTRFPRVRVELRSVSAADMANRCPGHPAAAARILDVLRDGIDDAGAA